MGDLNQAADLIVKGVTIITMIGGGGAILVKMGRMAGRFEVIASQQSEEITEIKNEVIGLRAVVTQVAVQKQEIANISDRVVLLAKWYDELRHGRGIVREKD